MSFKKQHLAQWFSFSWRDFFITAGILFCAVDLCVLLNLADSSDGFASPIFVLAVLVISRITDGYLFGLLSAGLGVIAVNYIFTYPYMAFNFTISGYPLSFLTFLTVSIITSTLTSRLKRQEQLRIENEKEKIRSNLLRSVSHDIRTPLTSIIGATSVILDNPNLPESEQQALLADVRDDAQWLIRVVENLLSITRMSDIQTQIQMEGELAEEVMGETARKFRKRFPDITVSVQVPENPLFTLMDPILIEQVLSNLMENSVLHGETTTHIWLTVHYDDQYARFSVIDDGNGIPPSKLPNLFDGTLKHSETSSGDGKRNMGLGLSVCMAIIRAHGGTMDAKNLPTGAEFSFCLPLLKENLS